MTSVEEYDVVLNGETVSSKTLVGTLHYSFDGEGKQFRKKYVDANGNEQKYVFEYQDEKNIAVQLPTGIVSHSKSDHLGRKVFDELQLGSGLMNRKFSYHEGVISQNHLNNGKQVSDPQTTLVKQIEFADGRIIEYEYDAEERITRVIDTVDGTYEYTYDELGQLLTEMRNGDTVSRMTYDDYANIINKNGITYTYGGVNWKDQLTRYGSQTIGSYDGNGNPRSYLGKTLVWEKGRQLKSFGSNTYTYNKDGIRTSKTVNGVKHSYVLDGTNIVKETWGSNTLIPLYDLDNSVCGIKYNNTAYYFYKNLQGDVIAITNASGTVIARYVYDAWGRVLQVTDAHCNSVADNSDHIANINPFRYRGYYYDQETQLYYLQSRYYDPKVGRFINADVPEMLFRNLDCNILNLFYYCNNDPINRADSEGKWGFFTYLLIGIAIAGIIGTGIACGIRWMKDYQNSDEYDELISGGQFLYSVMYFILGFLSGAVSCLLALLSGKMLWVMYSALDYTVKQYYTYKIKTKTAPTFDMVRDWLWEGYTDLLGGWGWVKDIANGRAKENLIAKMKEKFFAR